MDIRGEIDSIVRSIKEAFLIKDKQHVYWCGTFLAFLSLGFAGYEDFRTLKVGNQWLVLYGIGNVLMALEGREGIISVVGGICFGLVMVLISRQSEGKMGEGDAWIITAGSISLGFINSLVVVYTALMITFLIGIWIKKGRSLKNVRIPFIPVYFFCYLVQLAGV